MIARYHEWRNEVIDNLSAIENMLIDGHYVTATHSIEAVSYNVTSMVTMMKKATDA
jgi:hypothetical protein